MPKKINMMAKKISPKSMELLNMAVADFYSNFTKSNISDSVASMIKKSIPVEKGEKVNPNEFNTIVDGASSLMVDAAVDERIISIDEGEPEKAAEFYLQSIAQISNKYSALESQIRRVYVIQGIESGDFPNYEENPNKFQAFLDSTFEMYNFSKEELREGYNREISLAKAMEEEQIAESIKEKVVDDITETEENNKLFSDIIEEVENVKKEYDDADTTDGQKVTTQEDKDKEERENADSGIDDAGTGDMSEGGDMGDGEGDMGGDNPDEGGDPSEDDIPLGDEGYDATAIHSNRSPMGEEVYDSAKKAKKVSNLINNGKQGPVRNEIRKMYGQYGMASTTEEDNPDVDYEDNTETPLDDSYSPVSEPVDNPDADIENSEIDTYINEDEDKQADFNEDEFAREEEEVMREIAQQYELNIDTQGDSEVPKDTINPYRGMGETQLEEVDDDIASNAEVNLLSDENLKRRMLDESLLKYRMLPNYSAESIANLTIKLDGEKYNNLKKSVEKQIGRIKYLTDKHGDSVLKEKILSFESNWKKAEDITLQREALLNSLGIAPRKVFSTENIISLSITRNLLNSYSLQCKDKKLPRVCETLKLDDEKLMAKEALIETIFDLGRKAKKLTKTSDIIQAREDFIEAEREAEKKMEDLNLDENEVEMVDNLQSLLKLKEHKKIFQFDSLLNSYKTIFGTIEEKIKLSDELKDGTFNEKVVNNLKDKRGFLSKEDIDLVDRCIKGQDIGALRLNNPYAKFNILEIRNRDITNTKNYSQEYYANVAVVSKLLTTVYHTKEALLIGHNMEKDNEEMDSKLLHI